MPEKTLPRLPKIVVASSYRSFYSPPPSSLTTAYSPLTIHYSLLTTLPSSPRHAAAAAGMDLPDHTRALVVYMSPAVGRGGHFLFHGNIDVGATADPDIAFPRCQVVTAELAAAA